MATLTNMHMSRERRPVLEGREGHPKGLKAGERRPVVKRVDAGAAAGG